MVSFRKRCATFTELAAPWTGRKTGVGHDLRELFAIWMPLLRLMKEADIASHILPACSPSHRQSRVMVSYVSWQAEVLPLFPLEIGNTPRIFDAFRKKWRVFSGRK